MYPEQVTQRIEDNEFCYSLKLIMDIFIVNCDFIMDSIALSLSLNQLTKVEWFSRHLCRSLLAFTLSQPQPSLTRGPADQKPGLVSIALFRIFRILSN